MAKPIGTIGNIPTITISGRVYVDLTNLIILYYYVPTSGNFTTGRAAGASSGYQVSGTLTISSVYSVPNSPTAGLQGIILYGDNDVGLNTSAPTNPKYIDSNFGLKVVIAIGTGISCVPFSFAIPNGKYPAMSAANDGGSFMSYGYL